MSAPEPPVSDLDPFGHTLRSETTAKGRLYTDQEAYDQAYAQWASEAPVPFAELARVEVDRACPVCDLICETADGYAPGCYVPYAGRRWDCYELWGRNLSADERRALIEHESRVPRLWIELPDGSGPALV